MAPTTPVNAPPYPPKSLRVPLTAQQRRNVINYLSASTAFNFTNWFRSELKVVAGSPGGSPNFGKTNKQQAIDLYVNAGHKTWAEALDVIVISQYNQIASGGTPNASDPSGVAQNLSAVPGDVLGRLFDPGAGFIGRIGMFIAGAIIIAVAANAVIRKTGGKNAPQIRPPKALRFTPAGRAVSRTPTRTAKFRE